MTKDELNKIYNNAVDTLESEEGMYWTLKERCKYKQGYIEALINNGFINFTEALTLSFDLDEAIYEYEENK